MQAAVGLTCAAIVALGAVGAAAGCGDDAGDGGAGAATGTATGPVVTATTTASAPSATRPAQRPAPSIHTNVVGGVRMTREPIVLRDPPGYTVYVRTNRALPRRRNGSLDAALEVDGAHSGVRLSRSSPHKFCYYQDEDLLRSGARPSSDVPLGTRLKVRLYVGDHTTPVRATAPLRPTLPVFVVSPGPPPVIDPDERALRLLGCSRQSGSGHGM